MRTVDFTRRFKKDYKREQSGRYASVLDKRLEDIVKLLADDQSLPRNNFDHALTGNWSDHRDCHIRPDLVLIYRKPNDDTLELVRMASHSELRL